MCGIVGAIRSENNNVVDFLTDGLKRLEYRGYDSSGIAVLMNDKIKRVRRVGRVANMEDATREKAYLGNLASDTHAGQHMAALPSRMLTHIFQVAKSQLSTMASLKILKPNVPDCRRWATHLNHKPTPK